MSNPFDKEIDRLSREAADSFEPNDSFLSWSRLEQKLDQQMPERPPDGFRFGRMNPYVWGPAVVLLAGASFFITKNILYSKHSTQNELKTSQSVLKSDADKKMLSANTHILDSTAENPRSASDKTGNMASELKNASGSSEKISTPDANTGKSKIPSNYLSVNKASLHNRSSSNRDARLNTIASGAELTDGVSASEDVNSNDVLNNGFLVSGMNDKSQNNNKIQLPLVVRNGTSVKAITGNDSLMNLLAQSKTPIHQKSLHLNRSLNIGFTFGPDYTSAGGIANNQIGNNIGLTIGYYLTDKISLNTGMIYSNKFYWSNPHNYFFQQPNNITPTAYTRSFTAPPPIDYINGASNIWEWPLTVRYDFAHHNKTKFFANAGLSSYFMMKQTYIYFLHSGQNQLAYKISDNEQTNYWFGAASFSAGFEAEIGKGFSFQAEPFLKLPLRNMGDENLRLTSYGFMMSFKYAPVLSRSKK